MNTFHICEFVGLIVLIEIYESVWILSIKFDIDDILA